MLIASGTLAVVGLALLLIESIRALGHASFNSLAASLLWVGVGLIGVAGILALVAISRTVRSESDLSAAAGAIAPAGADN